MHSTTLRGVFPEPKPVYRRNFIKENVKSIKQMQGILQEAGVIQPRKRSLQDKFQNIPKLTKSKESNASRSLGNLNKTETIHQRPVETKLGSRVSNTVGVKSHFSKVAKVRQPSRKEDLKAPSISLEDDNRLTHRGMQTEREEDLAKLYETGIIKYPSPAVWKAGGKKAANRSIFGGEGDHIDTVSDLIDNLGIEDKDFIKENKNIKPKAPKQSPVKVLAQAPPNYQRGVVPKYLRDRKDDSPNTEVDADCPPGHILLPEEERKETLRVLRQSYADRIQELNMMPVRNDTLKMRKRKMEIEEELKRIDGGIKVFQRPKVFVKINA